MVATSSFPNLLQPLTIKNLRVKNRMVAAPMGMNLATTDGYVTQESKEFYRSRSWGGFGLVVVEACPVRSDGLLSGPMIRNTDETYLTGLSELVDVIHEGGARASIQLMHAGAAANPAWIGGRQAISPSGVALKGRKPPRELSADEVEEVLNCFASAAGRCRQAGYDAILIHMAHGTLPHQFMTPLHNKRKDKWGELYAFPLELLRRVRRAVGDSYPLMVRISGSDFMEDGAGQEHMIKLAQLLEANGADVIDVSAGRIDNVYDGWFVQPVYKPRGCIVFLAEEIKKVVRVPVVAVGRLNDPHICEQVIAKGKADLVALGRVSFADPDFPRKVTEGRPEDIRKCAACDLCTRASFYFLPIKCAINFDITRLPWEYEIRPADQPKKVMIVGGGVGGMEAARIAFLRKHLVTLYEKESKLGGAMLNVVSTVPRLNTRDLRNGALWQIHELGKLGVKVELNKEVTPELVAREKPDIVILATGSLPLIPEISGLKSMKVITIDDYLKNRISVGNEVVILGGGYGAETALSLDREGKKVTLIEETRRLGETPFFLPRIFAMRSYLNESGVRILMETKVREVTDEGVTVLDKQGNKQLIKADTVINALGRIPNNRLAQELRGKVPELYEIGDCWEPLNMMNAIHTAARLARRI